MKHEGDHKKRLSIQGLGPELLSEGTRWKVRFFTGSSSLNIFHRIPNSATGQNSSWGQPFKVQNPTYIPKPRRCAQSRCKSTHNQDSLNCQTWLKTVYHHVLYLSDSPVRGIVQGFETIESNLYSGVLTYNQDCSPEIFGLPRVGPWAIIPHDMPATRPLDSIVTLFED